MSRLRPIHPPGADATVAPAAFASAPLAMPLAARPFVVTALLAFAFVRGAHAATAWVRAASVAGATSQGAAPDALQGAQIGATAPELALPRWIAGAPAFGLEPGKVHFVVFWAPWSGASTQSLTRLGDLARRNAATDLVVTGVAGPDGRGSTFTTARERLRESVSAAPFRCGWDESGAAQRAWLGAPGERALPCAFLVDRDGHVAAIGAPGLVELRVASVLAGAHDLAALAREAADHGAVEAELARARDAFQVACRTRDWERALGACDELLRIDSDGHRRMIVARFQILLARLGRADDAYAYGRELLAGVARDDIGSLAILAWTVVDPDQRLPRRDLAFAGACAQRAVDLSQRRNATLLDTLARVHHAQGELDQAIAIETEAVRLDAFFAGVLADYRRER